MNGEIIRMVLDFMKEYRIAPYDETTGKGLVRHVLFVMDLRQREIMVCLNHQWHDAPEAGKAD